MKKIISWILLLTLTLSLFAGCGSTGSEETATTPAAPTEVVEVAAPDENLASAIEYLKAFYKGVKDGTQTPADFERLGTVRIGLTAYEVVYTVDCDERDVAIVRNDDGTVTIDVNEDSEEEVPYALTATVTGTDGTTASLVWNHILPVSMRGRGAEIVDAAYALENGEKLPYEATLTGEIISVDTPYSPDYKNVTVSIKVEGREDKPIQCYRLKGEGADQLVPGDVITVSGILTNYKGKIEFDAGCQLLNVLKTENSVVVPEDPEEILKQAFSLKPGEYLPYTATITGRVVAAGTYSPKYGNRIVSIRCGEHEGYLLKCYRLKGQNIENVGYNDIITVTGNIMSYDGTIEFDSGCIMDEWIDKPAPVAPSDPAKIVEAAYKLDHREFLPYYCTLTGKVDTIVKAWNVSNNRITVNMTVAGKTIQAYKLRGEGIEAIKVGDTITVYGQLTNYRGTIEFNSGCVLITGKKTIVDELYELEDGESLEGTKTLIGTVSSATVSGSSATVVMTVSGKKNKPITCVGLTGSGYNKLEPGDTVTVKGTLSNSGGTYQFNKGCTLVSWKNANLPDVSGNHTSEEIVEAAKLMGTADKLAEYFLWGEVTKINEPYSESYGNITVTIDVAGTPVKCYRMKGKAAPEVSIGDTIRVYGTLINYNGNIEFTSGCKVWARKAGKQEEVQKPATLAEQMAEAVALGGGYNAYTSVTQGKIVGSVTYHSSHNNHSFYVLDEKENIQVYCYAQSAPGYTPETGDTVKVEGKLTSHNGKAQFDYTATLTPITKADGSEVVAPKEPEANSTLTCAEANALGATKAHNTYTTNKYYVTGKITSISNTTYGNLYINDGTGTFYVYGVYDGSTRYDKMNPQPQVGDTITVYASIGQYSGTPQMKNAQLKAYTPAEPDPTEAPAETEPTVPETTETAETVATEPPKEEETTPEGGNETEATEING